VHKETLQMVHNQLVNVLHNQCMEKDNLMSDEIRNCPDSEKALLLQEVSRGRVRSIVDDYILFVDAEE
jgi:hypothetical protein